MTILGMLQKRKTITMTMRIMAKLISFLMDVFNLKWANLQLQILIDDWLINVLLDSFIYLAIEDDKSHDRKKAGKDEPKPVDVEPGIETKLNV